MKSIYLKLKTQLCGWFQNQDNPLIYTESDYIDFVNRNTQTGTAGRGYMDAISQLEEHIGENIFNAYSLDELRILKNRLLKGGNLHEFNIRTDNRAPSAAIGKLIEFRRSCEFQTGVT